MSLRSWWAGILDKPVSTPEEIEAAAVSLRAEMAEEEARERAESERQGVIDGRIRAVAQQCSSAPMDDILRPDGRWHCCHNTLHLEPLYGSYAPTILVNHDCQVHGDGGHTQVYRQVAR